MLSHFSRLKNLIFLLTILITAILPSQFFAQTPHIAGDYTGTLGPLHLKLHIKADAAGTLDSPDQGANGIPATNFHLDGATLTFEVPLVHGTWKGTIDPDGKHLNGIWSQGSPLELNFTRDDFVPAAKPSAIDGIWLGTLHVDSASLRIQLILKSDASGHEFAAIDSLDQKAFGIEGANVLFVAPKLAFDIPAVKGHWEGNLSADGNTLTGTWSQGTPLELNFTRQASAIAATPPKAPTFDPALPPVSAADLKATLDKDLAQALNSGELAPSTKAGVSIGIIQNGQRRVFSYGTAKPDSIFEIGSITKTFTGLILAQLATQKLVSLDTPVRELLPTDNFNKPGDGEVTLLDIATQHSGLPRMPDNLVPKDPENPYADYTVENLYAFLHKQGLTKPTDAAFLYSNLGFGLLGQALANRSNTSYESLLKAQVFAPLGLADTTITLTPDQRKRFIPGHSSDHSIAHSWELGSLQGAGAIRSTAGDMLTYLEANLHPDTFKPATTDTPAKSLAAAIKLQHELRADAFAGQKIALAWLYDPQDKAFWHNGATGGYSSNAFFIPEKNLAVIVLFNYQSDEGSFADKLAQHIRQRLLGQPAIALHE